MTFRFYWQLTIQPSESPSRRSEEPKGVRLFGQYMFKQYVMANVVYPTPGYTLVITARKYGRIFIRRSSAAR